MTLTKNGRKNLTTEGKIFLGAFAFVFIVFVLPVIICSVNFWLAGSAKSNYLKQTQNINLPSWQAAYIRVQVNTQDISFRKSAASELENISQEYIDKQKPRESKNHEREYQDAAKEFYKN